MRERLSTAAAALASALAVTALLAARPADYSPYPERGAWTCTLSGSQALPPNSSLATGECDLELHGERIHAKVSWRDLSGPVLRVEFHGPADANERGPILWSFAPAIQGRETSTPAEAEFQISHTQSDLLRDGRVYADIATATHPRGEIRGRLVALSLD